MLARLAAVAVALTAVLGALSPLAPNRPVSAAATEIQPAPATRWVWPLRPLPVVVRDFDPPPRPWLPGHRGVDLGGRPAAMVYAAGPGTVVYAGSVAGRGVVSIEHADGLRTTYEPVTASVRTGDAVRAGDEVGALAPGHAGCSLDACLHWGLRRGQTYLDPLLLLRPIRVRLKPTT